jgi:hypothetical protein
MLAAGLARSSRLDCISQAFSTQRLDSAKLIVQRTRSMRASEASRVLRRMAAAVRRYPEVNDGQQIFAITRNKSSRKGAGTAPQLMCDSSERRSMRRSDRTNWDWQRAESSQKACEDVVNCPIAAPNATQHFSLKGKPSRPTAAPAKRK